MFVGVEGTLQSGVAVYAVMNDGTRQRIGITDISGGVTIEPAALTAAGAVCLLFEKEGYFTGAIWLSGYQFSDPDLIELAKFVIP